MPTERNGLAERAIGRSVDDTAFADPDDVLNVIPVRDHGAWRQRAHCTRGPAAGKRARCSCRRRWRTPARASAASGVPRAARAAALGVVRGETLVESDALGRVAGERVRASDRRA